MNKMKSKLRQASLIFIVCSLLNLLISRAKKHKSSLNRKEKIGLNKKIYIRIENKLLKSPKPIPKNGKYIIVF